MPALPQRPRSTLLAVALLWLAFYGSFTLFTPALLDDADSVHSEVAREMLLRHDPVTLYANGIRYLEKAPLLYWSMAASMKVFGLFGATAPHTLAAAARLPLAFSVLALALLCEALARRMYGSARAGLYAALIVLSSFGIFIFTRITIPDAMVCLWLTLALYAFWRTEDPVPGDSHRNRNWCFLFAGSCALNVLTKGLIGLVFPLGIVALYLLLTRGVRGAFLRFRELHPGTSTLVFLLIAAPWHIAAGLANPTQGHPAAFHFIAGHWQVPMPSDGNVRGWFWFYFMNEHVLRYLNLRVPRDYDTAPLWLFWGLCLVWLMPWSAFLPRVLAIPVRRWASSAWVRLRTPPRILALYHPDVSRNQLLLILWAALPLLFFSLSTRQEYYVLPSLPAFALIAGGWLSLDKKAPAADDSPLLKKVRRINFRVTAVLLGLGTAFAGASVWFLLHTRAPAPNTDLAQLLAQNPGDYALSMGHFLDLNAQALGLFRVPLGIAALSLFAGPLVSLIFRKKGKPHAATIALAAGAFGFLLAAHMGLRTFAPVLTSAQLAEAITPQVQPGDLIAIHGEYESGSTLGFYLKRNDIHILEGRSSNLWYGSFFPDAPPIFETPQTFAAKWSGPRRIFLWQSTTDEPRDLPPLTGPVYVLVRSGGKEIVSNQPNP
ncbi:MAG TPA: phospholipid carrier-dependent glycosyltransferase [Acidobacteriaceae bacterium]|jgi:4-amino-4-deoxy-L-arabinose transferase-like glycosyltransferase